jgi:hypothetical protein
MDTGTGSLRLMTQKKDTEHNEEKKPKLRTKKRKLREVEEQEAEDELFNFRLRDDYKEQG